MELYVGATGGQIEELESAEVERDLEMPGRFRVTLAGRSYEVDIASTSTSLSLLVDGHQYDVMCHPQGRESHGGSRYSVAWGVEDATLDVLDPLAYEASKAEGERGGRGAGKVLAYMPGKVVSVLAKPGDEVAVGQGILVLEAMKMENEIQAETAGVLGELFVEEGQAVDGGDPLFEVVPKSGD